MIQLMEHWKPIAGFEDLYAISSFGRVMRTAKGGAAQPGKILKNCIDCDGYMRISLLRQYVKVTKKIHRLVAEAFIGAIPDKYTVNHIDGIKSNNNVTNLEIVTRGENISHAFKQIKTKTVAGSRNPKSKISELDVLEIRRRLNDGESPAVLVKMFGVSKHTISNIKVRKTWTHI